MDYLKFKFATIKKNGKAERFKYCNPLGDLTKPELIGLIASNEDYDLATPNLIRSENISLIASNSSTKNTIQINLKWRPTSEHNLVTLLTDFKLVINNVVYEYNNIETYKPLESNIRLGRITQYGSIKSNLKLFINSPYRRMRILFRGHMKVKGSKDSDGDKVVFVKLNLITCATSSTYDFLDQYNQDCFKESYLKFNSNDNLSTTQTKETKTNKRGYSELLNELLLHDCHEHSIRIGGNCSIDNNNTFNDEIFLWGFHTREFLPTFKNNNNSTLNRLSILTNISNGQLYHIGINKLDNDKVHYGFTCFAINSQTSPIDKPFELYEIINDDDDDNKEDNEIEKSIKIDKTKEFKVKVFGQNKCFETIAKRRDSSKNLNQFYDVDFNNGIPGWAFVNLSENNEKYKQIEEDLIVKNQKEYLEKIQDGKIFVPKSLLNESVLLNEKPLLVNIENFDLCSQTDLVGSKASSLALLKKFSSINDNDNNQYKVSNGFVLTKFAYDLILEQNPIINEEVKKLENLIGERGKVLKDDIIKENCLKLVNLFSNDKNDFKQLNLPQQLIDLISKKLNEFFYKNENDIENKSFAIRSSSWGEDEQDMSAAGQLSTILNVKGLDNIIKAIMACFGSKFSYENVEYKRQHGLPLDLPMAVIIQEMINCKKAGVLFSCDPTNGDESLITITANYGLGESVVSGQSEPDSIKVRRSLNELKIEEIKIGSKLIVINGGGGDNVEPNYDKTKCCLSNEEILKLAKCSIELVEYHQSLRDIEWGFENDELYLFQSRPITGLDLFTEFELLHEGDLSTRAEYNYVSRANIGEVMPFAAKPLTLTYCTYFWSVLGARMFKKFSNIEIVSPNCAQEVIYECYHSFFNLRCSTLFPLDYGNNISEEGKLMSKAMQVSFFGHDIEDPSSLIEASRGIIPNENPFCGRKYELNTFLLKKIPMTIIMREKQTMLWLRKQVRELKLANGYNNNKLIGLYNQMKNVVKYAYECWENHINIIMLAGAFNMGLSGFLTKYIKDANHLYATLTKFFAISPNVISAEIPKRIEKMAKLIMKSDEGKELFAKNGGGGSKEEKEKEKEDIEKCLEFIMKNNSDELTKEYNEFIELFGHRCYNEFELSDLSWRENQNIIIDMLRKNCLSLLLNQNQNQKVKEDNNDNSEEKGKLTTIDDIIDSIELATEITQKDRFILKNFLVPKVQLMVACRERTKDILIDYTDILRETTQLLAKELLKNLRIPDENLFYYLYYDELEPLIRQAQPTIVLQALRRRNMWNKNFKTGEAWKFDEIISGHFFKPNHLKPSKELDEKLSKAEKFFGTPASSGKVQGKVCLVNGYNELNKVRAGDILLTHSTDIAFSPVFPLISGIITEVGGLISHGAVVAREYGLPSILGIPDITRIIKDGEEIILDANNGVIIRLNQSSSSSSS